MRGAMANAPDISGLRAEEAELSLGFWINQEVTSEKPPWSQAKSLLLPLLNQAFAGLQASCPKDGVVGLTFQMTNEPVT